jgi:hypothetical protein
MDGYYFFIKIDIYPFDIMVSIGEDNETLLRRLKRYGNKESDCYDVTNISDTVQAITVILPSNQSIIRFRELENTTQTHGLIAHEIFHVATFIMDRVGMKFELMVSDEAYAYLIGKITREFYKKVKI